MAGRSKQRTTFAKLNRETRMQEKRREKEARKAARKLEGPVDPLEGVEVVTELRLSDDELPPEAVAPRGRDAE
ncbi:hypothetical protein [Conexibacter sp. SYSU D00693]|uniref:hypothetical protein n=1 Tax=Conexibacter sp. SYSU D00693 TaxID=2812560 RepID=UPI00196B8BF2|nr:hypothetical protein [Conexibacter sp. SYSU D00693]